MNELAKQVVADIEPLLKISDVVKILNVSPSCVRELARKGELKGIKFTSDWHFKPSAIKQFIEDKEYHGYQARKNRLAD